MRPEVNTGPVVVEQAQVDTVQLETLDLSPSPTPEPMRYENTVTLLVDRNPVMTLLNELSAKQSATLISQIKKQGMRALFVENRSDSRLLKQIADDADRSARRQFYRPVPLQRARAGEQLT